MDPHLRRIRRKTTLPAVGDAESFRLFGHAGLSHLRLIRTREQHLRWSHESAALALTSPGGKHEQSAMRHGGPALRPQSSHGSSLSRVIGRSRMPVPVAWQTALAVAAAVPTRPTSPNPLPPISLTA